MKKLRFKPSEILFSLTGRCNLTCSHCAVKKGRSSLNTKTAIKFINACADFGIKRVGFTGGEPFLATGSLSNIIKEAIHRNISFNRIMTNAVWFGTKNELTVKLKKIFDAGYDGDICVSVDAFHRQDLKKVALFIETAIDIFNRPDIVSIAAVIGAKDGQTRKILARLAHVLKAHIKFSSPKNASIRRAGLFIKIFYLDLSAVGKAAKLKDLWDGKWFKDDFCRGPGNAFFVLADGTVKPCCGYANDSDILTIGSIKTDTPKKLLGNAGKNRFVSAIFGKGLHSIRRSLEKNGARFPGKTRNHCFFCHYLLTNFAQKFSAKTS
ncbi:MAG: 4Fe-4S cluster-binding domain-containing protein [Candidatus Omnitrophota bacterium]|nr:4Fe-4S cluster-binding domain-containing protein [Candidatus Omnitrophota bacterium]